MNYRKEYERWLSNATDEDIKDELEGMDEKAIEDAFYRDLAFGTGGLRNYRSWYKPHEYLCGRQSKPGAFTIFA